MRPLRSDAEGFLEIPVLAEAWLVVGPRGTAFSGIAPRLWNALPMKACLAAALTIFQRLVRTFLFKRAFNLVD